MSLIVEFNSSSPEMVLHQATTSAPGVSIRVESVDGVPPDDIMTMLWASGGDLEAFDDAIREDSTVTDVTLLDEFENRALYRYRVAEPGEVQLYTRWIELGAAQLYVEAKNGVWRQRVRFPNRGALREFQSYAASEGIQFNVEQIYDEPDTPRDHFLTNAQEEALELALERGYFEVPRETDLATVAAELEVSEQSVSERLRRAMRNLARDAVDDHP